jgi:adenylate kinase family enzyme
MALLPDNPINKDTLVVCLYGGPGSGKSTTCAGLFAALKQDGVSCEQVLEYAKDLIWEGNKVKLEDQIYIFAKQNRRTNLVLGQVDAIITDSPLLLSIIYGAKHYPEFKSLVFSEYRRLWTLDVFVERAEGRYDPKGREQTEEQARQIDDEVLSMLGEAGIQPVRVSGNLQERVERLKSLIEQKLADRRSGSDLPF